MFFTTWTGKDVGERGLKGDGHGADACESIWTTAAKVPFPIAVVVSVIPSNPPVHSVSQCWELEDALDVPCALIIELIM